MHEQRETRIHPDLIPFSAHVGQRLSADVIVKNLGNVETRIAEGVVVIWSAADEDWHDYVHQAARASGAQGYEPFFDNFSKRLGESELPPSRAKVRLGAGPLLPLETRAIRVELELPSCLKSGRRYLAVSRLGDGALTLILNVLDAPQILNQGEVSQ